MSDLHSTDAQFDFDRHRNDAIERYRTLRPLYECFANDIENILRTIASSCSIKTAAIQSRTKSIDSFGDKAATPSSDNPEAPKYTDPLSQIEDLAAARVITFGLKDVRTIDHRISAEFTVLERSDRSAQLLNRELVGYHSIHYIVSLRQPRTNLPEYIMYTDLRAEVQIRTVLQHAWAEIEHDIQYKSTDDIPRTIRQRFANLAGLLAIADREFQSLQDEAQQIRKETQSSVEEGRFDDLPITADSLKAYADNKLGEDRRMTSWSYDWTARLLRKLEFSTLSDLDRAVSEYDDDAISRIIHGSRLGQLSRLEDMVMASMGSKFVDNHPLSSYRDWRSRREGDLERVRCAGLNVG